MSALARLLHQQGHTVSGSDRSPSDVTRELEHRGMPVYYDHDPDHFVQAPDVLVHSAAIAQDNPERCYAQERGVQTLKYAQLLGQLSKSVPTYAIAGTHGKSTSSAWLAWTLQQAGRKPGYVIGAQVDQLGGSSDAGAGQELVVEACEYDRSFLNLRPKAAAILNIEADHLDYYRDLEEIVSAFAQFAGNLGPTDYLIAPAGPGIVDRALADCSAQAERYGLHDRAHWQAGNLRIVEGRGAYELIYNEQSVGQVHLQLSGRHNVENSLAVAALAHRAGLPAETICRGLESFQGVSRRMTFKAAINGITVLDDYAHHPTEIRSTLAAIAGTYAPRRLWCVFQPHQHSRTRFLLDDFALSFAQADVICLLDIYFVRDSQNAVEEVTADTLAQRIRANGGDCRYLGSFERILAELLDQCQEGDLVVTMGAGDIWKVADEFIRRLGRDR